MNFLIEFGPGWLKLINFTTLRHDFLIILFDYFLAKTLEDKNLLFKALCFGMIRTIYLKQIKILSTNLKQSLIYFKISIIVSKVKIFTIKAPNN